MKLNLKTTYNKIFNNPVNYNKSQIIYNLRVDKENALAKANVVEESATGLAEIAKINDIKIRVISSFQQPFISVKRKGLKSVLDSIRGIFVGEFSPIFEKESILKHAQNAADDLKNQVGK